MMLRRAAIRLLGAAALLVGVSVAGEASAGEVIKIGTLAPASSPWGQVFKVWAEAVAKRSNDAITLQFFYDGQQGDEGAMVGKMKDGQLDGAVVTAVGLSKAHKPILALQIPGLFTTWAKLDAARDAMKGDFEQGITDAGFTLLGWADVGAAHLMSRGFEIKAPDDIKGKKPYMRRDDIVQGFLFQIIGVAPVPLNLPEVLPNLNTGAVDIVISPSLAAEQFQWSSKLNTIVTDNCGMMIGALLISSRRLSALSEGNRSIVLATGRVAANALTKRIRAEDAAAFNRLKGKMTVVNLSAADKAKWDATYTQVRQRLTQGTFSPDLIAKLGQLAK